MDILLPQSEAEVADVLHAALQSGRPLSVLGNGTKHGFGHAVSAAAAVSVRGLSGILDYEPAELVMSARAGTPLEEIEAAMARNGQHLAFEPPQLDRLYGTNGAEATIGGVFMANLAGPRRFRSGAARDHALGMRAVNGRGEIWKTGGRVIKNVTGYDLGKLLAGSWGTLSIVTEVSFKVLPAPEFSTTLAVAVDNAQAALGVLIGLAASPLDFSGLACLPEAAARRVPGAGEATVVLARLEGTTVSVKARLRSAGLALNAGAAGRVLEDAESRAAWRAVRDVTPLQDASMFPVVARVSVPPAALPRALQVLECGGSTAWYADAAGGWLWLGLDRAGACTVVPALRGCFRDTGSVVLYRAPDDIKLQLGVHSPRAPALSALAARIKQNFDPAGILNPGRLYRH